MKTETGKAKQGKDGNPINPNTITLAFRLPTTFRLPKGLGKRKDLLEPELERVRESIKDFTQDIGDILTVTLYPKT
ncbi:hypothetical protein ACFLTR_01490 [Chloroflexota bacterium]